MQTLSMAAILFHGNGKKAWRCSKISVFKQQPLKNNACGFFGILFKKPGV
jgi:hypothetical protein